MANICIYVCMYVFAQVASEKNVIKSILRIKEDCSIFGRVKIKRSKIVWGIFVDEDKIQGQFESFWIIKTDYSQRSKEPPHTIQSASSDHEYGEA